MASRHALTFPGTRAGLELGFTDLRRVLDGCHLEDRARYFCELVFEEIVTNIIKYGYADDREHRIEVLLDVDREVIALSFEDDGRAFNPLDIPADIAPQAQPNARIGGRGLVLVRMASRDIHYERTPDGRNRLNVTVRPD